MGAAVVNPDLERAEMAAFLKMVGEDEAEPAAGSEAAEAKPGAEAKPAAGGEGASKPGAEAEPAAGSEAATGKPAAEAEPAAGSDLTPEAQRRGFYELRRERERREAAEQRLRELEEGRAAPSPGAAPTPDKAQQLEGALRQAARAQRVLDGEVDAGFPTREAAQDGVRQAVAFLGQYANTAEVMALHQRMLAGAFGPLTEDVEQILKDKLLPVLPLRQAAERERMAAEERAAQAAHAELQQELARVPQAWPETTDPKSPQSAYLSKWIAENVGTSEKPGPDFALTELGARAVGVIVRMARAEYAEEQGRAAAAERDGLRSAQERRRRPERPGPPAPVSTAATGTSVEVLRELEERVGHKLEE